MSDFQNCGVARPASGFHGFVRALVRLTMCIALLGSADVTTAAFAQTADEIEKAKNEIWEKEKAIYASNAQGGDYYFKNSAPGYLAWVYSAPKPFRRDRLGASASGKPNKAKITNEFMDFSLQGDTAIIYYMNHRTMLADGTPVDQKFANIHVWIRDGKDWKILASMSRLEDPEKK